MDYQMLRTQDPSRRSMKTTYVLPDTLAEDGSVAVLEMTTYHFKDSKSFASSVNRTRTRREGVFTVSTYDLFEAKPFPRHVTKVARYSVKALEAEHAEYVGNAEAFLPALLQWASEKEAQG